MALKRKLVVDLRDEKDITSKPIFHCCKCDQYFPEDIFQRYVIYPESYYKFNSRNFCYCDGCFKDTMLRYIWKNLKDTLQMFASYQPTFKNLLFEDAMKDFCKEYIIKTLDYDFIMDEIPVDDETKKKIKVLYANSLMRQLTGEKSHKEKPKVSSVEKISPHELLNRLKSCSKNAEGMFEIEANTNELVNILIKGSEIGAHFSELQEIPLKRKKAKVETPVIPPVVPSEEGLLDKIDPESAD